MVASCIVGRLGEGFAVRARPGLAIWLLLGLLLFAGCAPFDRGGPLPKPVEPVTIPLEPEADEAAELDASAVREMQRGLNALGYDAGAADGIVGQRTRGAIRKFQAAEGLPVDGAVSEEVRERLRTRLREAKAQEPPQPEAAPAPVFAADPPNYQVGATYVYSDGRAETVAGLKGDLIRWVGADGSRFTTHRNFLLPPVYWEGEKSSGSTSLDADLSDLWLEEAGQQTSFVAHTTVKRGEDLEETDAAWRCRAVKNERLKARLGTFDTLKVSCESKADGGAAPLRRVWHYAPGLEHYLRRSESAAGGWDSELIAIRPGVADWPPIARAALGRAIEWALDSAEDGQAMPWSSSGVDTRVTIAVDRSFKDEGGASCRAFAQVWSDSRGERRYPGVACRGDAGAWTIPGLRGRGGKATAVSDWMS